MPDGSLGGYFEKHSADKPFAAALIFVRWSADGAQPVGHLETEHLAVGDRRADVKDALHALSLHDVKAHLERLIEQHKEQPDW
jgi:hypothetical protein